MASVTAPETPSAPIAVTLSRVALALLLLVFVPVMCLVFAALPAWGVTALILKPTGLLAAWSGDVLSAQPAPAAALLVALGANLVFGFIAALLSLAPHIRGGVSAARLALHAATGAIAAIALALFGFALTAPLPLRAAMAEAGFASPPSVDAMGAVMIALWSGVILIAVIAGALSGLAAWAVRSQTGAVETAIRAGIRAGVAIGILFALALIAAAAAFGVR